MFLAQEGSGSGSGSGGSGSGECTKDLQKQMTQPWEPAQRPRTIDSITLSDHPDWLSPTMWLCINCPRRQQNCPSKMSGGRSPLYSLLFSLHSRQAMDIVHKTVDLKNYHGLSLSHFVVRELRDAALSAVPGNYELVTFSVDVAQGWGVPYNQKRSLKLFSQFN
ncbi:hypothetical protein J6590_046073 [Homalodisca vitripennis]|nr:hypothetical protein J6590_046073 [Homalodisca vitripennis]